MSEFVRTVRAAVPSKVLDQTLSAICDRKRCRPHPTLAVAIVLGLVVHSTRAADGNWASYLGDPARTHYWELKQITRRNVPRLQVAWTYHSGDARADNFSQIQCNPLII